MSLNQVLTFGAIWSSSLLTCCLSGPTMTIEYYIGCVEMDWDFAPNGDQVHFHIEDDPREPPSDTWLKSSNKRIGSKYKKGLFREFTDSTFTMQKEHDPLLGALGPVIRAEVGDLIKVFFKNMCSFPASMHPHGVLYEKSSEGAPYDDEDGVNGGDIVYPNGEWIYEWFARTGCVDHGVSSKMWLYHSHVDEVADAHTGLFGPIVITQKGMARSKTQTNIDLRPKDVSFELFAFFVLYNENEGRLYEENSQRVLELIEDEDWKESNLMHSINGYLFGNWQPTIKKYENVRWHLASFGNEMDGPHSPHWHGNIVTDSNGVSWDVIEMLPGSTRTVDMEVDQEGEWLFHCHVHDHIQAGMITTYHVEI